MTVHAYDSSSCLCLGSSIIVHARNQILVSNLKTHVILKVWSSMLGGVRLHMVTLSMNDKCERIGRSCLGQIVLAYRRDYT